MPDLDVSKANIIPYVHLADASVQDYSTQDGQFPGLHNDLLFLWAMADTEDGKRYELIRMLSSGGTFDFIVHECSTDLWAHPTTVRFPYESDLYWGPIVWADSRAGRAAIPVNFSAKHSLSISLGPAAYVWKEDDGLVEVVLTPLPMNVTAIYVPGLPDDVGYTSSGCTVAGSIAGSRITGGYGGLDRMYCLPGLSAWVSKIAKLEHYWFVWGSILEDGRWETGNAMLGAGDYATATFHREGESPVIATNGDVSSKIVWETKGEVSQPRLATLTFGGRTFNFEGTHNAAAAAVSLGIAWLHGTMQEEGGPTPVRSWSTMEIIKSRATSRE
ncbi:hypothetical protein CcI49_22095 [Frankia sp. CcI49]|uniref:hypothetical protein n=1 Tax=Frankia sp. CcI49 TaxID=1745382 RepID=UPI000977DDA0|nr:hypothetical protein [Frankia sp. CcI49]ONH58200.1 hypothetical protein CcI49_22095 [Frankia sp. CcI49]